MHQPRRHKISKKATADARRRLDAVVRPVVHDLAATIEETAMMSGICPLCLGIGLLPRE